MSESRIKSSPKACYMRLKVISSVASWEASLSSLSQFLSRSCLFWVILWGRWVKLRGTSESSYFLGLCQNHCPFTYFLVLAIDVLLNSLQIRYARADRTASKMYKSSKIFKSAGLVVTFWIGRSGLLASLTRTTGGSVQDLRENGVITSSTDYLC